MSSTENTNPSKRILGFQDLIQSIPKDCNYLYLKGQPLKTDDRKLIVNLAKSVENASVSHASGLSAIGELLAHAADEMSPNTLRNIGWLIHELGEQLFHMSHLQQECEYSLHQDDLINLKRGAPNERTR